MNIKSNAQIFKSCCVLAIIFLMVTMGTSSVWASGDSQAAKPASLSTLTFTSIATQDGCIRERTEHNNIGGVINRKASVCPLGDDAANRQQRIIFSFNTANIPDTAIITSVILKIKQQAIIGGGNPVIMLQGFMADIKNGSFGTATLQAADFQATASKTYGPFKLKPVNNWYTIDLTSVKAYINKLSTNGGLTQIRLRFKLDDNNNKIANYLSLFSGNAAAGNRPQLIVTYSLPATAIPTLTTTLTPTKTYTLTPTPTDLVGQVCSVELGFDQTGILPSSQGFSYTGTAPENVVFSVSNGLLHMNTIGIGGSAGYQLLNAYDHSQDFNLEFRMKVFPGTELYGVDYEISDAVYDYEIGFDQNGIGFPPPYLFLDLNTTDDFHTYKFIGVANSNTYQMFIDEQLAFSGTLDPGGDPGQRFIFGDLTNGGDGQADIDFVRYCQSTSSIPTTTPIPKPTASDTVTLTSLPTTTSTATFTQTITPTSSPTLISTSTETPNNSNIWIELSPVGSPPAPMYVPRQINYDAVNNRLIAFFPGNPPYNGNPPGNSNEVWVLTNANGLGGTPTWIKLNTTGPLPGSNGVESVIYDSVNNKLIVYGGCYANCSPALSGVFTLSHANGLGGPPVWSQLDVTNPQARTDHSTAYDLVNNLMISFGGHHAFYGTGEDDTRILSNANGLTSPSTWTVLSPLGSLPDVRSALVAVYDQSNNRFTIFGGDNTQQPATQYNDVWVLENANGIGGIPIWTQLTPTGNIPAPRNHSAGIYDTAHNRLVIFGGQNNSTILGDLWELSYANGLGGTPVWTELSQTGAIPGPHFWHTAAFDVANQRMIVLGGYDQSDTPSNRVWVLTLNHTLTVTTLVDTDDGVCDSDCSLREAIALAIPGDTINFAPNLNGTIALNSTLTLNKNLVIDGPETNVITLSGNNAMRVMTINSGTIITINHLTIANGKSSCAGGGIFNNGDLTLNSVTLNGNSAPTCDGGAIYNNSNANLTLNDSLVNNNSTGNDGGGIMNEGTLTMNNSPVSNNIAANAGGGLYNYYGSMTLNNSTTNDNAANGNDSSGSGGGGIYNRAGTLALNNSSTSDNTAKVSGGGIHIYEGTVTLNHSNVNTNQTTDSGGSAGGIFNMAGTITITDSKISGNTSLYDGGGILNHSGTLNITHSLVSGNTASPTTGAGGGIINYPAGGTVNIANSTIMGNSAASGGGLYQSTAGTTTFTNTTIAANSGNGVRNYSGVLIFKNTIIANNSGADNCMGPGDFTDGGHNLQYPGTNCGVTIRTADPLLGSLADNGGPTLTMALLTGSPAIDAGDNVVCAATSINNLDQRGATRPLDGNNDGNAICDIGAYESPINIALNPSGVGYPNSLESDSGWGGGSYPWDMLDGHTFYTDTWAHGLAFTGGTGNWMGQACGWRQATINFGALKTFNRILVWHHGDDHIPSTYTVEYWDGSNWLPTGGTTTVRFDLRSDTNSWGATPTETMFPAVTGSKVRFSLNNCDITHGWIYQFDVFGTP